jgi:hypothetical protein
LNDFPAQDQIVFLPEFPLVYEFGSWGRDTFEKNGVGFRRVSGG